MSVDPGLTVELIMYDFSTFDIRNDVLSMNITKEMYIGQETELKITKAMLDNATGWNGDLMYVEMKIVPSVQGTDSIIQKFYIQRDHIEEEYDKSTFLTKYWFVLVICVVFTIFFIFMFVT